MSSPESLRGADDGSNPQKSRTGLHRMWHATLYSMAGLRAAWIGDRVSARGAGGHRHAAAGAVAGAELARTCGTGRLGVAGTDRRTAQLRHRGGDRPGRTAMARLVQARQGHGQRRGIAEPAAVRRGLDRCVVAADRRHDTCVFRLRVLRLQRRGLADLRRSGAGDRPLDRPPRRPTGLWRWPERPDGRRRRCHLAGRRTVVGHHSQGAGRTGGRASAAAPNCMSWTPCTNANA